MEVGAAYRGISDQTGALIWEAEEGARVVGYRIILPLLLCRQTLAHPVRKQIRYSYHVPVFLFIRRERS